MVFGRLFKMFKSERGSGTGKDLTLHDLDMGFIVDYEMRSWEVKEVAHYDWGNGFKGKEFKIFDGKEYLYLYVDPSLEELSVSYQVNVNDGDVLASKKSIINTDEPLHVLQYDNKNWIIDDESLAEYKIEGESDWMDLLCWTYVDQGSGDEFVALNRWGEKKVEAYRGKFIKPFEISNILPRKQD